MLCRKYIQKVFTLVEVMIVFAIIAFHLASTLPGFLRARKFSQASKILILARSSNPIATV
jgi:type II secretory pathway pseudopilin PulG